MPTYEYVCTSCGHRFEAVQSFSDPALASCSKCEGPLRKVFGNVGIVLKGSGFYKTDSRKTVTGASKNGKEAAVTEAASKDSTTSTDGGAKESAPVKETAAASSGSDKTPAST